MSKGKQESDKRAKDRKARRAAVWDIWIGKPAWNVQEAADILSEVSPFLFGSPRAKPDPQILDNIQRAVAVGDLTNPMKPQEAIIWALKQHQFDLPVYLEDFAESIPGPVTYKTGVPGRNSSKHIFMQEFQRRAKAGALASTAVAESRYLAEWLLREHPGAASAKPGTIANAIRSAFREVKKSPQNRPTK